MVPNEEQLARQAIAMRPKQTVAGAPPEAIPRVSPSMWAVLQPLIDAYDPPRPSGRRRGSDSRMMLDAMLYRLTTGCAWNRLPAGFPHASSVYRTYRRWLVAGLLDRLIAQILDAHLRGEAL
jgi:transposase